MLVLLSAPGMNESVSVKGLAIPAEAGGQTSRSWRSIPTEVGGRFGPAEAGVRFGACKLRKDLRCEAASGTATGIATRLPTRSFLESSFILSARLYRSLAPRHVGPLAMDLDNGLIANGSMELVYTLLQNNLATTGCLPPEDSDHRHNDRKSYPALALYLSFQSISTQN